MQGLCLHQCKIPAQQFFADELGLRSSDVNDIHAQMGVVPLYS